MIHFLPLVRRCSALGWPVPLCHGTLWTGRDEGLLAGLGGRVGWVVRNEGLAPYGLESAGG